jgi:hypothetical protein
MTYRYIVTAVCRATVTETWTLACPRPLTEEEIREVMDAPPADVELACVNEAVTDEEDRDVIEIEDDTENQKGVQ